MTPSSDSSLPLAPAAVAMGIALPETDVRTRLDQRALRGWTESSRRVARTVILVASDMLAGVAAIMAAESTWTLVSGGGRRPLPDLVPLFATVFFLQPLALRVTGAYAGGRARTDILKLSSGVAIAAVLGWVQAQLFGRETPTLPNKAAYLYSAFLITLLAWLSRVVIDRAVRSTYRSGRFQRRVIVVGSASEADELAEHCASVKGCELQIIGHVSTGSIERVLLDFEEAAGASVPYLGDIDSLEQALSVTRGDGVIVASSLPFRKLESIVGLCFRLGAVVTILPRALKRLAGTQLEIRQSAVGALLQLRPLRLDVPQLAVKRLMDIALTASGVVLMWPLFVLIAIAIKLDSRGPVLFSQPRAGVGGKPFRMLKFRTMRHGADDEKDKLAHLNVSGDPRLFKIHKDPRITRVGRILRRTSLDELPQVLNVLRGDMSLVGPRPFFPGDLAQYEQHHFERLHVLPGITGLWQVSGRSDVVDFDEVVRLDLEYIRDWSLTSDLVILLKTIPAAFGRGAY
jgi:exopolysaccharide biosynthesis polyprenyl glycosylphosphotransferase